MKRTRTIRKKETAPPQKAPWWYYVVLVLLPVTILVLIEGSLRLFGYGKNYKTFINLSTIFTDKLYLNPDITEKYFTNLRQGPASITDGFDEVKKENAFRIFVLGGSSTAGWPYPTNAAFSRYIKRRLDLLYPDNTIEVINCGISAVNSYTIKDIVPGIIEQKPDLILIYAGHNEYYGALGVGSTSSLSRSVFLTDAYLWFQQFRTTQLLRDLIKRSISFFKENQEIKDVNNETLMGRMIGESLIPYGSDIYHSGIHQFEKNMNDVLKKFRDNNVPVIISTLASNLKDLRPFNSAEGDTPSADQVYNEALELLKNGNDKEALPLFIRAKDLDALRFRAPAEINNVIKKLASDFEYPLIDIDSVFNKESAGGIVGYNLMVDHLHPTVEGYTLIGKEFFKKIDETGYLPGGRRINIDYEKQDSILTADFPFTPLDSTIAHLRILLLTGSYPFVPRGTQNLLVKNFKPKTFNDTLAASVINKEMFWEVAHAEAAKEYYYRGQFREYMKEIDAIIQERPYNVNAYEYAIDMLKAAKRFDEALKYLYGMHNIEASYYTKKWIGQIELDKQNYQTALLYLRAASKEKEADWQTWYNLAGAYFYNEKTDSALAAVEMSIKLNPSNPRAQVLYKQLRSVINQ
jgi:tetratricopeptide (TPR) repeat protein